MGAFFVSADSEGVSDACSATARVGRTCERGFERRGHRVRGEDRKVEERRILAGAPHPRLFFVRVANKGLRLDVARKSGRCRT
jgi:hypothetical protein